MLRYDRLNMEGGLGDMDWLTQMNEALDYIESHLTDEIDLDEIGRINRMPGGIISANFP